MFSGASFRREHTLAQAYSVSPVSPYLKNGRRNENDL
ncbi:hypothetical protein H206_05300 [Candidatus Electrothrix aarhusensis]|uniref:Uncharacterized protein n=1 Tax=Candidatus Electrothrix aarhusensis TaxID=1859131 RepID=A0A3S3QUJ9_9BACT|nr:hypothetical protein H206_05300 [Candidatus Electrothrix aarhusensis]